MYSLRAFTTGVGALTLGALMLSATTAKAQLFGDPERSLHFFIISNIEGYQDNHRPLVGETLKYVLKAEFAGREKRSARNRRLEIIFTAEPTKSSFAGTPDQIYRAGPDIMKAAQLQPKCNDLHLVYQHIAYRIERVRPDQITVTHIGPMFNAPVGCTADTSIVLPQELPSELHLSSILADPRARSFTAYLVHPDQQQPVWDHIKNSGVTEREQDGDLKIELHTPDTTIDAIGYRETMRKLPPKTK